VRTRKRIKRAGEVALISSLSAVAKALPPRAGRELFAQLGATAGRLARRDLDRAVANLAIAFPDAPLPVRRAMASAMCKQLGRNAFELLRLEGATPDAVKSRVSRVEGLENFDRALARGKGIVVVTGHIGCWELLPAYFVAMGYPVTVVGRRMSQARLNRDDHPRPMFDVLSRGEILGVLIDQHTRVAGIWVPFFGRPAHTPTAVAKLAIATGAAIVPMALYLERSGTHVVRVLPEVTVRNSGSREADVRQITEDASRAVEDLIRLDPSQWVWFHRRWREPDGASQAGAYAAEG